jgi:radical SAM-linked protein
MLRYRIFYQKRREACFIPHIVLPTVFTRAASRASYFQNESCEIKPIIFHMTEGFSPHAKMSFASELPVGVVALMEPVDMWLENSLSKLQFKAWGDSLPTGFILNDFYEVPNGSPSLSKSCPISEYLLKTRAADKMESVKKILMSMTGSKLMSCKDVGEFTEFTTNNNAVTLGTIVRELISENVIDGWHELCIVRVSVRGVDK